MWRLYSATVSLVMDNHLPSLGTERAVSLRNVAVMEHWGRVGESEEVFEMNECKMSTTSMPVRVKEPVC